MSDHAPTVIHQHRHRSFLGSLAAGLSALAIVVVLCGSGLTFYGMWLFDAKTDAVVRVAGAAIQGLPQLREALPPIAADVLSDRRDPAYAAQLAIRSRILSADALDENRQVLLEIQNSGDEVVTLLALRAVVVTPDGVPVYSWQTYAATPIMADDPDWRGPLYPGSTRVLSSRAVRLSRHVDTEALELRVEITDLRTWQERQTVAKAAPGRQSEY